MLFPAAKLQGGAANRPRSILILPVVNETSNIEAPLKEFLNKASGHFRGFGYYVFPVSLTSQVFAQEGAGIADEAQNLPHSSLRRIFGADAALYITVTKCGLFLSTAEVAAKAELIDLRTGDVLWVKTGSETKTIRNSRQRRGLLSDLASMVVGDTLVDVATYVNDARNIDYDFLGRAAAHKLMILRTKELSLGPYQQ